MAVLDLDVLDRPCGPKAGEIAETTATLLGRTVRLIVRRQPKAAGDQLGLRRPGRLAAAGNWPYWQAAALAHNVGLWLRTLALPRAVRRARGKRLRLAFLNVAARLVRHGRRLHLRFGAAYPHVHAAPPR